MKKIIIEEKTEEILLGDVVESTPIFAKKNNKLVGMLVYENDKGWILMVGKNFGLTGYHETRKECLVSCVEEGLEFFVDGCVLK